MSVEIKQTSDVNPEIAKMNDRGQVTIPPRIRTLLNLGKNSHVGFKVSEDGVLIFRVDLEKIEPYSREELRKFVKISAEKEGQQFESGSSAKKHLDKL
jgi:AbrB family looped-hinge helix DNA binding protein